MPGHGAAAVRKDAVEAVVRVLSMKIISMSS
jgi:hypothetical protein